MMLGKQKSGEMHVFWRASMINSIEKEIEGKHLGQYLYLLESILRK